MPQRPNRVHWYDVLAVVCLALALWKMGPPGSAWDGPRIVAVFVLMIALIRHGHNVGLVIILSAGVLGRLFALSWGRIADVMTFGVFNGDASLLHENGVKAIGLGAAVFFITMLGVLLVESKVMRRFILAMEGLIRDVRWLAAMIPAMIGLLPMPGGAMLSAPIVGELSGRLELDRESKTLTNFWFRHVWEYGWVLYPAVIYVATEVPGATIPGIMLRHAPLSAAAIVLGIVAILLPIKRRAHEAAPFEGSRAGAVAWALWPIAAIVAVAGVTLALKWVPKLFNTYVLAGSALAVIVVFCIGRRVGAGVLRSAVRRSLSLKLILLVIGVYVMRGMFEASGAADGLPRQLAALAVPVPVMLFLVPWVVGMLTGYSIAAVATTFPLLIDFLADSPAAVMLAYAGGFLGVMLSPVHLCLVLTRDYFDASWRHIYRKLILYVGIMSVFAFVLYAIYAR